MAHEPLSAVVEYLRKVSATKEMHDLADAQLLHRFVANREDAAFAVLVHRHGPMVMGVCRRVLGDAHNTEDAFQATFLVLIRKAASLRPRSPLGNWLYGVAQRVALKARAKAAAHQNRQRELTDMPRAESLDDVTWQELRPILDEEIGRLSQKYRAPLVLCYFEGKSHEQAARELGCPKRTLTSRLATARDQLRRKLTRRGITLSIGALTTALAEKTAPVAVGAMLTINTMKAATSFAAGRAVAESILSTQSITLAEEVMKGMIAMKVKQLLVVVACSLAIGGMGVAGYHGLGDDALTSAPLRPRGDGIALAPQPQQDVGGKQKNEAAPGVDFYGDPLPAGAVVRLGSVRWVHDNIVRFTAFMADGKTIVTTDAQETVRIWEFPTGKEMRKFDKPQEFVGLMNVNALSADGKVIARLGATEIYLQDLATGKPFPTLQWAALPQGRNSPIGGLVFSPNSDQLAALDGRGNVRIWDWAKGKETHNFAAGGLPYGSHCLAFTPDGTSLATATAGSDEKSVLVRFWNPVTGKEMRRSEVNFGVPHAGLAFSPDSKTLAICSPGQVSLIEVATGKQIRRLLNVRSAGASTLFSFFSKDSTKLYTNSTTVIQEWDIASGKQTRSNESALSLWNGPASMSADGKTLVAGAGQPRLQFYDLGAKSIHSFAFGRPQVSLLFTPDGQNVLTQSRSAVYKWDSATGMEVGWFDDYPHNRFPMVLSPSGKLYARAQQEGKGIKVTIVETMTKKAMGEMNVPGSNSAIGMRFSPDSKTLAIFQPETRKIELYEVATANLLRTLDSVVPATIHLQTLVFSPDGKALAGYEDSGANKVIMFDTASGKQIGTLPLSKVRSRVLEQRVNFSPDGRCLALDMNDGTTVLYELASGQPRFTFSLKVMQKDVLEGKKSIALADQRTCFAFSPDGRLFVQAGWDGIVHLWDIRTHKKLGTFTASSQAVNAVAFAPDGKTVASASDDTTSMIWDVSTIERPPLPANALQPVDLGRFWQAMSEPDAGKAWNAMVGLTGSPKDAVAWIGERLKPATPLDPKRIQELLAQLDDNQFKVRDKATNALLKIGERILPAVEKALAAQLPLEHKQRLEALRGRLTDMILQGDRLRDYRAIEVLELIATPEARQVLETLAAGAPGALVTTSAQAALKR